MENYRNFKQIINTFYAQELSKSEDNIETINLEYNNIKIIPKLLFDEIYNKIIVEFKVGKEQFYKIKSLPEFYDRIKNNEIYKYGNKLEFVHNEENFDKQSAQLLKFILKYADIIKYANDSSKYVHRYYGKKISESSIWLNENSLDEIFEILKGRKIEIEKEGKLRKITFIPSMPNIEIYLNKINYTLQQYC